MSSHSSIEAVEYACMIAREAPVYSEADYEAILECIEEAHAILRRVFLGGQMAPVPNDWRIDGLLYVAVDKRADAAKTKLIQRYRATKFFAGQRRGDRERAKKAGTPEWHDLGGVQSLESKDSAGNAHSYKENVGEAAYLNMKKQGFDVRRVESGRSIKYQYASKKDVL